MYGTVSKNGRVSPEPSRAEANRGEARRGSIPSLRLERVEGGGLYSTNAVYANSSVEEEKVGGRGGND